MVWSFFAKERERLGGKRMDYEAEGGTPEAGQTILK